LLSRWPLDLLSQPPIYVLFPRHQAERKRQLWILISYLPWRTMRKGNAVPSVELELQQLLSVLEKHQKHKDGKDTSKR
jgi:hypothetical protein